MRAVALEVEVVALFAANKVAGATRRKLETRKSAWDKAGLRSRCGAFRERGEEYVQRKRARHDTKVGQGWVAWLRKDKRL